MDRSDRDRDDARRIELDDLEPEVRPAPGPARPAPKLILPDPAPPAPRKRGPARIIIPLIVLGVLGGIGYYGQHWWTVGRFQISTDDAYVEADFSVIAPKVSGYIAQIPVQEYAPVRAGDALLVLEDGDYRIALAAAEAKVDAQQAAILRVARQIDAAVSAIEQAEAAQVSAIATQNAAVAEAARYERLTKSDFSSVQKLESTRAARQVADAGVAQAEAGIGAAKADLAVVQAQKAEAEAALRQLAAARDQAARDLEATVIRAPFDGVVGNLNAAVGDYVTPGKTMLAVVPMAQTYVVANFKETEIARLTPGTPVRLVIDAYPGREVRGQVVSVAPASGSVFSLLPVENATGNFTKVVQRVPVRIAIPEDVRAQGWLRPGFSVVATAELPH